MPIPQVINCPHCQLPWPWEYNYCPKDGRSFAQLKRQLLTPAMPKPRYAVDNLDHLPEFLKLVVGDDWETQLDPNDITVEWLSNWLANFQPSWRKPVILYFGFNDGYRRSIRAIVQILKVKEEREVREKLKHVLWTFKPPLKTRPLIDFATEDATFDEESFP